MQSEIAITIQADPDAVFTLAADVERWPEILPHYRWVRRRRQIGARRILEMAARRDFYPVRWTAVVEPLPDQRLLRFRHIKGPTKGMEVEWRITPVEGGTHVVIWHSFVSTLPLIGPFFAEYIAGRLFINNIAGKTLRRMKEFAERERRR